VLRRTILLVFASAAALGVVASAGGAGASGERRQAPAEDQLLETITVSAGTSHTSETDFQPSETYKVVFSGSMHTQCEKGRPFFGATSDDDVFYVYNAADQNGPVGSGRFINFFFTGRLFYRTSLPPFSEGHTYTGVPPYDLRGRFVFADAYPVSQLEHCTRTGAWTVKIYRVESGTTKTVSEPAPGRSTLIESPELPTADECGASPGRALAAKKCRLKVDISSSSGDLDGTVILGEGSEVQATVARTFVFCWLTIEGATKFEIPAAVKVRLCIKLVKLHLGLGGDRALAALSRLQLARRPLGGVGPRATGCRTERMTIGATLRKGKVVSAKKVKNRKLTASSVRYSCTVSGGKEKITITGPSNIQKALGKKLTLVAARAKKAPRRSGKLSVTFGW
jgi:hypothetical protein